MTKFFQIVGGVIVGCAIVFGIGYAAINAKSYFDNNKIVPPSIQAK